MRTSVFLLILAGVAIGMSGGCNQSMTRRALPAPVSGPVEVTLKGRAYRWWGADNFSFGNEQQLHYILVRGIRSPAPDEKDYLDSVAAVKQLIVNRQLTIQITDRDFMMREIGEVSVAAVAGKPDHLQWGDDFPESYERGSFDLGLKLIELGWAQCNGDDFPNASMYRDAESRARNQHLGIWADTHESKKQRKAL